MQVRLAGAGMGMGGAPQTRAAPSLKQQLNQPLEVNTPERQGPFHATAGGIPVDKPFYRKKISVKDYISMRKKEHLEAGVNYRIGEVIVPEKS